MKKVFSLLFSLLVFCLAFSCSDSSDDSKLPEKPTVPEDKDRVSINGHYFVDLGLPSRLLWAETNVGASSASGYGEYFAWGV